MGVYWLLFSLVGVLLVVVFGGGGLSSDDIQARCILDHKIVAQNGSFNPEFDPQHQNDSFKL